MDLATVKSRINEELSEITGVTGDHIRDEAAITPVLERLATRGWQVVTRTSEKIRMERAFITRETRRAEVQAFFEARGDVRQGDNTYECTNVQFHETALPLDVRETVDGAKIRITEERTALGLICARAHRSGDKPANWLRDGTDRR